jgi:hypothetical protein
MKDNPRMPKKIADLLKEEKTSKSLEPIKINSLHAAIGNFFSKKLEESEEDKEEYIERFTSDPRSDEEVEELTTNPNSPYHKLIKGYIYHIDVAMWITTGCGGAQFMYKSMLREGMDESMIEQVIYVTLNEEDKESYPLAALKLKNEE